MVGLYVDPFSTTVIEFSVLARMNKDVGRHTLSICVGLTGASSSTAAKAAEPLPFETSVDPDVDLVLSDTDEAAYFSCRVRAGRQRQIHRLHIPTGVTEASGRTHVRIDAQRLTFRNQRLWADGAVWLSDGHSPRGLSGCTRWRD